MSSYDQAKVQAAAEKFKLLLPKVRTQEKRDRDERLFKKFQPIFSPSHLPSLTAEEFARFTTFKENEHWTAIHRQNGSILKDLNLLKNVLSILVDESRPIAERIDEFRPRKKGKVIKGFGSAIYTAILYTLFPDKYPVRNRKTVACLKEFGLYNRTSTMSFGENYQHVIEVSHALCEAVGCTISELDGLYHFYLEDKIPDIELPRVFKLSPGARGSEWNMTRESSVAAIGWNGSGPLSDHTSLRQAARNVMQAGEGGDVSYIEGQFEMLYNEMENGDLVLYYVEGRIIGVGIVCGPYQFRRDVRLGHQRPVRLVDPFTPVKISNDEEMKDFFYENVTLKELEDEDLRDRVLGLIAERNPTFTLEKIGFQSSKANVSKEVASLFEGFKKEAFDLLMSYRKSPTRDTYQKSKSQYEQLLRDPARALFQNLAPSVRKILDDRIETRKGILSVIQKNDYGKGGIHDHYWGAFFPSGAKRTESPQLYVIFYPDQLRFGFGFGYKSKEHEQRLLQHIISGEWLDGEYLKNLNDAGISMRIWSWKDKTNVYSGEFDISKLKECSESSYLSPNFDLSLTPDEVAGLGLALVERVQDVFSLLLPLYILATSDDPSFLLERFQEGEADEEVDLDATADAYAWSDFCADQNWSDTNEVAEKIREVLGTGKKLIGEPKQLIFFGPPGTGKSRAAHNLARALTKSSKHIRKIQFHQSYGYEQFIEGIRPHLVSGQMSYTIKKGAFVEFCEQARKARTEQFVMIIDEINRGNVSKIFGELMYLLEYREETLPLLYSQEPFSIPSNVTIIATMNSADRSLALVDYALRRRFQFVEFGYQPEVLRGHYRSNTADDLNICLKFIELINAKIGDPRLQIGHSYFLFRDARNLTKQTLREVWNAQIYPLLQEYFLSSVTRLEEFSFDAIWREASEGPAPGEAA
jgi:DNA polymerase III delta prime subunit